jgi:hypothetical protein
MLACERPGREGAKEVKPRESRLGMAVTICLMIGVVLLPLGYIALIGPILWLAESGYIAPGICQAYCAPAAFVADKNRSCLAWLHAYARLCVPQHAVENYPPPD